MLRTLYTLFLFIFMAAPQSGANCWYYCEAYVIDGKTELGHMSALAETTQMLNTESILLTVVNPF